jgi:hypothetical protein
LHFMKLRLMEFHGIPWNYVNWRNLMEFGFDRDVSHASNRLLLVGWHAYRLWWWCDCGDVILIGQSGGLARRRHEFDPRQERLLASIHLDVYPSALSMLWRIYCDIMKTRRYFYWAVGEERGSLAAAL